MEKNTATKLGLAIAGIALAAILLALNLGLLGSPNRPGPQQFSAEEQQMLDEPAEDPARFRPNPHLIENGP